MSEKRILLASLLKPINDTRLYEKLATSLSKLPGVQVHIGAYTAPVPATAPDNIHFHPVFDFKRLSTGRLSAQADFYRLLKKIKPDLIIVSTHELLLASLFYKMRHGAKVVYDIRENYALNLRAQHNYSSWMKHVLAFGVRGVERGSAIGIDHFLLAERSYADELPFLHGRYTFVENKYKATSNPFTPRTPVAMPQHGPLHLLYSGTIAEEYGIWEAIELAAQLRHLRPETQLTIIGYCANAHTWQKLQQVCEQSLFIHLIGGDQLVPHSLILEHIQKTHIGLLPYRPNASTFRCIPTKLYEYMAHGLPILIQQNPAWQGIVQQAEAGLSVDFSNLHVNNLYNSLLHTSFYSKGIPANIYWQSEENKLLQAIQPLLG
jgi:glycogen synthase